MPQAGGLNTVRDVRQDQTRSAAVIGRTSARKSVGKALPGRFGGIAVFVIAIGVAPPAVAGDLTITPSLDVRQTYSDNVDLDPDGEEESALTSELVPGVRLRSESARVTGALNAFPILRHQTDGEDEGYSVAGDLAGLGTMEAAEDLFFVDAQASVSQRVLSSKESASSANEETVIVYSVSPYLRNRFGGFANSEVRYTLSQVFITGQDDDEADGVSDTTTHKLGLSLDSGRDFSRLRLSLSAFASEEDRSGDDDVSRREVNFEEEYAFNRHISAIAGMGYQHFDDGDPSNDIDDPTWKLGFGFRGSRTELKATYGERDDDHSANVNFRYDIGPRTVLTASYSEVLDKSQERLVRNTSNIDLDGETDSFIDDQTGLPFDPNQGRLDISDETTRDKTFRLGLNGTRGRNTFAFNVAVQNQTTEPSGEEEDFITVGNRFSRRLSPDLTLNLFAGYERTEFDDGQVDNEYAVTGGLTYDIYSDLQAGLRYGFRTLYSDDKTSEYTENRITVFLRRTF